jgi:hypothetical protein
METWIEELQAEMQLAVDSTTRQRQTLYRLGKSRSWVKRFAATRAEAAIAINLALQERNALEIARKAHRQAQAER